MMAKPFLVGIKNAQTLEINASYRNERWAAKKTPLILCSLVISLSLIAGCGTIVGIPSHGGGKRFAVEQELIASTAKAVAKHIDVSPIRGKRATLFFVSIGDQGSGTLSGGRLSFSSVIQSIYSRSAPTVEFNTFPVVTTNASSNNVNTRNSTVSPQSTQTTSTSTVTSGNITQSTTGNSASSPTSPYTENETTNNNSRNRRTFTLSEAETKTRRQEGNAGKYSLGLMYNGLGTYSNAAILNPNDTRYLSAVIQSEMIKNGVTLTNPNNAEILIYIAVDVFGTIRSRTDLLVVNNEKLKAKTALSVDFYSAQTGKPIGEQQNISFEAEYKENYIIWTGPFTKTKKLRHTKGIITEIEPLPNKEK